MPTIRGFFFFFAKPFFFGFGFEVFHTEQNDESDYRAQQKGPEEKSKTVAPFPGVGNYADDDVEN
nr:MAG: hypothetical protein [Bacteriophage sp.]